MALRQHRWTVILWAVVFCVGVFTGWEIIRQRAQARRWELRGQRARAELLRLETRSLAPTFANTEAMRAMLMVRRDELQRLAAQMTPPRPSVVPSSERELWQLAGELTADLKRQAARRDVRLATDEAWGLASATATAQNGQWMTEARRLQAGHRVAELLFSARPKKFFGAWRESAPAETLRRAEEAREFAGLPAAEGLRPLRVDGALRSEAWVIEFEARTPTLRRFLQNLAQDAWPFVVRRVAVAREHSATTAKLEGLVVEGATSRFTVVVEFIEPELAKEEEGGV